MKQPITSFQSLLSQLTDASSQVRLQAIKGIMHQRAERGQALASLLMLLNDPDEQVCQAAIKALGTLGDGRAVTALSQTFVHHPLARVRLLALKSLVLIDPIRARPYALAALNDPTALIRRNAVSIVSQQAYPQAVNALIKLLGHKDVIFRRSVIIALGTWPDGKAVGPLIAALKYADAGIRCGAAEALGNVWDANNSDWVGSPQAVAPLITSLSNDEIGGIRGMAAEALGRLKDKRAMEPLLAALNDPERLVRWRAAEALGRLGDGQAVDPLIALLKNGDTYARQLAARVLSILGDRRALAPLIATLDDEDVYVRCSVAEALGELGESQALDALLAVLNDGERFVRWSGIEALGHLGDGRAVKPLVALLGDEDLHTGELAARALGELGERQALEPLVATLANEDINAYIRMRAAEALGMLGDQQAVAPLTVALTDWSSKVREAAARALDVLAHV